MPLFVVIGLAVLGFNFATATHNVKQVGCLVRTHHFCRAQHPQIIVIPVPVDPDETEPVIQPDIPQEKS